MQICLCMFFIQILSIQTLKFRSLKRVLRKYDFEFNVSVTSQNSKFLKIIEINLLEHAAKFGCGLHFYWYPPVSEASGDEANFIKTKTCTVWYKVSYNLSLCLSATNPELNYLKTGKTESDEIFMSPIINVN